MSAVIERDDLIIGMSPLGRPSGRLSAAVSNAGALAVLDLGPGDARARAELAWAVRHRTGPIGVRLGPQCEVSYADLAADLAADLGDASRDVTTLVLSADTFLGDRQPELPAAVRVLVEVVSLLEARAAVRAGAHGLIARGNEAGGRVGDASSFVLLQQLLGDADVQVPVWLCGGVGPQTAAAAVAGGAAGVVLDTQLALLAEAELRADLAAIVAGEDGTETRVVAGSRVLRHRTPDGADVVLPLGQDAFLASRFQASYGSVGRAVAAVRGAILDAVAADAPIVLAPGSAFARSLGVELPVVQGPMTRVSDTAGFAAHVAEGGALPFLALALLSGEQTRSLLERTQEQLGDSAWGVGVLGFAPEQTRAAQLEVIHDLRPRYALIAGGLPAQARALEDVGTSTFLHVASPALLRQFLDAGSRKFVFEGSECGGHVGPRSSFCLWESQLGVLLDFVEDGGAAADLQVLFAGGIHDERSAAMVSALAAPLSRRGGQVGVLMGTAYLFTEEAVAGGAVQPAFQERVLSADSTALLETAPGHTTRCVPSPFVTTFAAVKDQLEAENGGRRDVWEKLEELNVGRLRIASKGLQRVGSELSSVGEQEQHEQGLFMAGQVATLRSSVTTIAALHAEVTTGAERFRAERGRSLRAALAVETPAREPVPAPSDIAIIGMACRYPGALDLADFWANVVGGVDSITEVPSDRWDPDVFFAQGDGRTTGDRTPSKWGGFLPAAPFDPLSYGIPPATLAAVEPVQLLALDVASKALQDAGLGPQAVDRARTSVIFAAEAGSDYSDAATMRMVLPAYLEQVPGDLLEQLPRITEDTFPGRLSNVIAGRIANRLDLGGVNFTVDAACGSSLAALDVACKELFSGVSDVVLCGAADLHNAITDYLLFSSVGALSVTGRSRAFDASADGTVLGEGVACVVLKRLADAERDGDRIYAVVKGVGGSSDGKSLGLTAPRPAGQRSALQRAYAQARISPAEVGLVEAHGTGTAVGDRTELETLHNVFSESGAEPGRCVLGSVKSQIGHTKCAAGLAGLIKTAMSLHVGVKPPTLHVTQPDAAWSGAASPFVFHDRAMPWTQDPEDRVAGVSAFGFGGTNFHAVLQGHASSAATARTQEVWPVELFTFRAVDHAGAVEEVQRLLSKVQANVAGGQPWRLRDLARTAAVRSDRRGGVVQVALLATDLAGLSRLLQAATEVLPTAAGPTEPQRGLFLRGEQTEASGTLAMLFPGQGSQRVGMLADLFVAFPSLRRFSVPAGQVSETIFPAAAFGAEARQGQSDRLRDTRTAQPALGVTGLAMHHLFTQAGVVPDLLAGHSYGELVALAAAGMMTVETLLAISSGRAEAILGAAGDDPGGMAAVAATPDEVSDLLTELGLTGTVVPANHNAPRQCVLSGPARELEEAIQGLAARGVAAKQIPVACAFHSPVLRGAGAAFSDLLDRHRLQPADTQVWSNRTATPYPEGLADVRAELAAQIEAPVRFVDQIEAMYESGARVFLEAGPGHTLSGLVDAILGDRPHLAVSCEAAGRTGLEGFLAALARLAVAGVELRTGWLTHDRHAVDVELLAPPSRPGWTVDGQLVRTADGHPVPGGYAPPHRITILPTSAGITSQHDITSQEVTVSAEEPVVSEFLRTSRDLVSAQRDVLLAYLQAPAAPVARSAPFVRDHLPLPTVPEQAHGPQEPAVQALPAPEVRAEQPAPAAAAEPERDALQVVLDVIAARTGYPAEMIEPELDLEADLGVDSMKRTEIAGELVAAVGADVSDERFGKLVRTRTAQAMAEVLQAGPPQDGPAHPEEPAAQAEPAAAGQPAAAQAAVAAPGRYVLEQVAAPAAAQDDVTVLAGRHFLVVGGRAGQDALAEAVAAQLRLHGAQVSAADDDAELGQRLEQPFDGLIHLDALQSDDESTVPRAARIFRAVLRHEPRWLVAAAHGAAPAPGLRGLFRSMALEHPGTLTRLVEAAPTGDQDLASALVEELLRPSPAPVVVTGDERASFALRRADLARPDPAEGSLGLDRESVVLLVGGARGITARFAQAFASTAGCRIQLAGRTVAPTGPEDPATAAAADLPALRSVLAGQGDRAISAVDATAREILAQREVAATLAELRELGVEATYRCVDVRDEGAVRQLVKEVHSDHGRIDGVVFGAGVIEDRLMVDQDDGSFDRVFGTKVAGAAALLAGLEELPHPPGFVVLFGSIAAVAGSRGQTDYAAANDALEALGARWAGRTGTRTLTAHWGPWAPAAAHGGMVGPELSRDYARRGISLLDPRAGVDRLLDELAWGPPETRAVVFTAPGPWTEQLGTDAS